MSNWGGGNSGSGGDWFERARPGFLIAVTVALLLLGAAFVFTDRYQLGQAGALPARLDRFTGQVIACIPPKGCFVIIPAGDPPLQTVTALPSGQAPPRPTPEPPAAK